MSAARRGEDGAPRLLLIDKPAGPTSFAVVRQIRRITGYRRVGHGGTLDPFATGLLVIGLGAATRLMRFVTEGRKLYEAELEFGSETDSEDCTGEIIRRSTELPDESALLAALPRFTGRIQQVPPRISAVHVDGERSYRRARRGEEVVLAPREVEVESIDLIGFDPPRARLRVRCGAGTYIRALARDLARELGSAAHLTALRRTATGAFDVADAIALDRFEERWRSGVRGLEPAAIVAGWPHVHLDPPLVARVRQGAQPDADWWSDTGWDTLPERVALLDQRDRLVAIATREGPEPLRLALVLPEDA